jgi:leader peptidase (prepilin peptidase) / N-methyltransferase
MIVLNLVFALLGLLVGGLINVLADDLPARVRPRRPHCPDCDQAYNPSRWLALARLLQGGKCPACGRAERRRTVVVEVATALAFVTLPSLISPYVNLVVYSAYIAILILVIVIDLEHRLILHVVTLPTTALALLASLFVDDNSLLSAVIGAAAGFILFYLAYLLGQRLFGPGALGFGDVTLAMTMGAMLGFHRIIFALVLGVLLGGLWSVYAILTGRMNRQTYFAYGPFLALAGIAIIFWGNRLLAWYLGPAGG